MLTDKTNRFLTATKAGAYTHAVEVATRSDRLARRKVTSKDRALEAGPLQDRTVAPWRRWALRAWILCVFLLAIAVGVTIISD